MNLQGPLWRFTGVRPVAWAFFAFLYIPIIVLVALSFNAGQSATLWQGFSFKWYGVVANDPEILRAAKNSLIIAVCATLISTALATLAALGMHGRRFRGQGALQGVLGLPLLVPDIVCAVAILMFFAFIGLKLSLLTILIAHITFCIPFAYLPIAARLQGIDGSFEQAARDLYASRAQSFFLILLPLMMPGVVSGYLLAFIISLDDFIITNFVKGAGMETLPTAIYGSVKQGIKPNIMAISTLMLGVSILFVTLSYLINRKGQKSL